MVLNNILVENCSQVTKSGNCHITNLSLTLIKSPGWTKHFLTLKQYLFVTTLVVHVILWGGGKGYQIPYKMFTTLLTLLN